VDYLLRTNKNIERKLIFDVLLHGRQSIDFREPVYVGFGSMWFGDFRLAHRTLGLETMISIEREEYAPRADYNRPYASVTVRSGDCLTVLRGFSEREWQVPLFAWLDFESGLRADVVEVIELFLDSCATNSVLIITVNALRKRYAQGGERVQESRERTAVAYLEQTLGEAAVDPKYYPLRTKGGKFEDASDALFRELLADSLLAFMTHKTRLLAREKAGKQIAFVPLFNLCHQDGAPMVTVGGAIAPEPDASSWRHCLKEHPVLPNNEGRPLFHTLDLIPITLKEKLALDACLPHPEEEFRSRVSESGLQLPIEQVEKYRRLNRHFPVFVESPI
jgi:hypothetical protein